MSAFEFGILGLYFLTLVILAIMGFHRYVMVWLYFKHKDRKALPVPLPARAAPRHHPAARSSTRCTCSTGCSSRSPQIRYPKDRLEIQVLDDSTDETTAIASRAVEHYRALGFDIHYLHRTDRTGYKAGALDAGLRTATGRVRPHLRRRLRGPARRPREDARPLRGPEGRHGAGALGPHQPRLLAAHRSAVDHARRALHHGARGAQPRRPLLQLQRHRRASGAAR